jgi:hypothetical protein
MILSIQHSAKCKRHRRGTTLIEAAIGLWFTCTVIIGCIDFSMAAIKTESLNHLAHRIGRVAIIHGKYANATFNGGPWGPAPVVTTLDGSSPVAMSASQFRSGLKANAVTVNVSWPNGNNDPGSAVLVETSMSWGPVFLDQLGFGIVTLRGRSYQIIQH